MTLYQWIKFDIFIFVLVFLALVAIYNIFQKEHSILRTYPLLGYGRYWAESLGVYLRTFFYARDHEELPFSRAKRTWIYEASKNLDTTLGFGSTRDLKTTGGIYFVDAAFPSLGQKEIHTQGLIIGKECKFPYRTTSLLNISALSYGSMSKNAILALSHGAKAAGCWLNTGEGGVTPYHLESGCDLVAQIGTAKFGFRDENGDLSPDRLKEIADYPQVKMFEIKLSQGAKPGKGGLLPAAKVTEEIAAIRKIPVHTDAVSPNRFPEISNCSELLDFINKVRDITGKPTGFKIVLGNFEWLDELCSAIIERGIEYAPDFISLDGAEGGTGAAPTVLADYMGIPITESLPTLVDRLRQYGLRHRIKVIASGKLVTSSQVAWALCVGADLVNSARGFMFALGCIQALRCHENTCPTGIASHSPWLQRGLVPANKAERIANYVKHLEKEVGMICHSCGVNEPRELKRHHLRIVTESGRSVSLDQMYPDKEFGSKLSNKAKNG